MRVHFVSEVTSNGGEVVKLEKYADLLIADQARKDAPPGSISYEFIVDSVKDGIVKEANDYIIRPAGEVREVGSTSRPTKSSRIAYTAEDDRILYEWVKAAEKRGDKGLGNKIYQDLEKQVSAAAPGRIEPFRANLDVIEPSTSVAVMARSLEEVRQCKATISYSERKRTTFASY